MPSCAAAAGCAVTVTLIAHIIQPLELTAADLASAPDGAALVTVIQGEDGERVITYEDEHGFPWEPAPADARLIGRR